MHWKEGEIAENFFNRYKNLEDPFMDYPKVVAFTDMVKLTDSILLEPYKFFEYIYKWYLDSYFILNTRNCFDWIASRKKHGAGSLVSRYQSVLGFANESELEQYWIEEWYTHHAKVIKFFKSNPKQFLIYDLDRDTPNKLTNFLLDIGTLNPDFFGHANKTKR